MTTVHVGGRGKLLGDEAVADARRLIETKLAVKVIESLRGHPRRASWVQQGIPLHDEPHKHDTCLFCTQPLTAERRQELTAHFDASLTDLQHKIDALVQKLRNSVEASSTYLASIPADETVYDSLRMDLRAARARYGDEHDNYSQNAKGVVAALTEKKDNPFNCAPVDPNLTLKAPETACLERVMAEHENKVERHQDEASKAARRVELYHLKNFSSEYEQLSKEARDKETVSKNLETEAADLRQQISKLESVDADPVPSANDLTRYVSRLLGRSELNFTPAADTKHYKIERNAAPATNLSEGEQTAIALLYFLVSVREDKTSGDEPIIIVDDPVSSLDNGILFGASAHLWAELVTKDDVSQVFLMTHNFEFFRQWLVQMESVPKKTRKSKGHYTAYEIRAAYEDDGPGKVKRTPELRPWNLCHGKTKKLRSQYNFLFSQVANGLLSADSGLGLAEEMQVMALMPNAARRMMESFLSFRRPDKIGSFHGSLQAILDSNSGLDQADRTRVERYLNTYSHLEEGDISRPLDPSESTPVLRILFQLMNHVDHDHVSSMCEALDIDLDKLLGGPA